MNSRPRLNGMFVRASVHAMNVAAGKLTNMTSVQIMTVLPTALSSEGSVKATRQLSSPHWGVPIRISGAVLKL